MAKKYIEFEQAKRALSDEAWHNPYFRQEEYAINVLNKLPAADVALVVHAHWTNKERYHGTLFGDCSNCGMSSIADDYCSNCGAKMDERSEDNV